MWACRPMVALHPNAMQPVIQHWLVGVARAASLGGAAELDIASDADTVAAWDLVSMSAGVEPQGLAEVVAHHYRLSVADLGAGDPHAFRLVPGRMARRLQVLPLRYSDRFLWVATADPVSLETEKHLGHVSGRSIHFEVSPPGPLADAIEDRYPQEEVHEIPPLDPSARGGPRILVVDDSPDTRHLLRTVLEKAGYRVTEAADGTEAMDLLADRDDPFVLATLDLEMPEMPGLEVMRRIRKQATTRALPVIVATGLGDPEVEMELFEAGADDFIVKPVDPRRLLLRIEAVLRRHRGDFTLDAD